MGIIAHFSLFNSKNQPTLILIGIIGVYSQYLISVMEYLILLFQYSCDSLKHDKWFGSLSLSPFSWQVHPQTHPRTLPKFHTIISLILISMEGRCLTNELPTCGLAILVLSFKIHPQNNNIWVTIIMHLSDDKMKIR